MRTSRIAPDDAGTFVSNNTFNAPGSAELELIAGGDTIPCDDGDGFPDPCTGTTIDCDDNC